MKKIAFFLSILLFMGTQALNAQTKVITGKVTSAEDDMPIPGVSISVQGTTLGTVSDMDGNYSLQVPENAKILVFSFVGMKMEEVAIGNQTSVNVQLQSETIGVGEVIVTAYGTTNREAKTGAVGTVTGAQIAEAPVVSVDKALNGKIAGVSVTSNSGQPGAHSDIRIRGTSSINAGNNPLWVVDGIPVVTGNANDFLNTGNALASLNPNDIESITVLKDAAAASIYGSRAANGVVLITTKSGKDGKTSFTARAKFGTSWLANDNDFGIMSADQLLQYQRDAIVNAGKNPDDPMDSYYRPKELLSRPLTNWMDHMTRYGTIQEYEVNATGSNAKGKYYTSLNYNNTDGVFYGVGLDKITGRLNADYKLTDALESGGRVNLSYLEGMDVPMQSLYYSNPAFAGMTILPWTPAYTDEGKHNWEIAENSNQNPRATAEYDDQWGKNYQLMGNIYLQWKPLKQVTMRTTNAIETIHGEGRRFWSAETRSSGATLQTTMSKYQRLTTSNTIEYKDVLLNDHSVRVLAGQEAMKHTSSYQYVYAPGVSMDIPYVQTGTPGSIEAEQGYGARTLLSFFGMLDYNYSDKYFLQASIRMDGSSLFGSNTQWGTFYSVGASWNIHNEGFMDGLSFVDLLKLRGSYGLSGNNNISAYRAFGVYASSAYNGTTGMRPSRPENPNLSWEKNSSWNLGLDFTLFENLDGNIDVYKRKTTDMLLDKNVPQTTGFSSNFLNIGSLDNRGIELQLDYKILNTRDLVWSVGGNISFNKTKILELGDNEEIAYADDGRLRHIVGKSLFTYRLFDYVGVDPTNGEALWRDDAGNISNDYNKAGYTYDYSPEPKFTGGFNTDLAWKGFSLGAFFEFKGGNHVLLIEKRYLSSDGASMNLNQLREAMNYWKEPGDTGVNPKPVAGNGTNSNSFSSTRFLQKGDYLRVKDVTLSYNLSSKLVEKAKIGGMKFYVSAQNIFTFHDVDWWDPERGTDGIGYGIYPMTKAVTGGIELSF
ncbi:TonB-linked outer membrane protein, SusC/RagA family [Mariniphaga anaerophila]|uniref:TonB-linked outer membrane protein, SusC/RagA family n=1 Tax=Mariniphaga anaerophila TaxID=1484053 RepID=A0A1M4VPY4_9BACT|nr:TonB-dependent receptor [Mariniphaga anaerophila]SHE70852.1 TonB-linked outer membrane protein, SusC/RagA family [Mariniphaga anaerophila]